MIRPVILALAAGALLAGGAFAWADEAPIPVSIKNHQFTPNVIKVPANQPVILNVTNADNLAEEFDSTALKVEKVIAGGGRAASFASIPCVRAATPSWANTIPRRRKAS